MKREKQPTPDYLTLEESVGLAEMVPGNSWNQIVNQDLHLERYTADYRGFNIDVRSWGSYDLSVHFGNNTLGHYSVENKSRKESPQAFSILKEAHKKVRSNFYSAFRKAAKERQTKSRKQGLARARALLRR